MAKKQLKLVSIHIKRSPQAMGLATLQLKTYLEFIQGKEETALKNLETGCLDFYLEDSEDDILKALENSDLDMVGFSTYIWNRKQVVSLANKLKKKYSKLVIFAGGAEASANPVSLLKEAKFDFVIKGEAELTLSLVMKKLLVLNTTDSLDLESIPGVYTPTSIQQNGFAVNLQETPLVENLDELPSPFLSGNVDLKNQKGILWELSRGCKFHCTYCYEGLGVKNVRNFSLERVQAELELFESHKINQVFVLDPIFNQNPKRTKEILKLIEDIAPQIHFMFEIRTEYLQEEIVEMFTKIHCTLQTGLESTNPEALKSVRRSFDAEKYASKIELLNEYNITFGLDLIYGLPQDSLTGFKNSLDFAMQLQPNHLDIFPLSVLPGTELWGDQQKFQLEVMPDAPYALISSPTFSETDMKEAALLSEMVDLFYNQGFAVPWFFMVLETLQVKPNTLMSEFLNTVYVKYTSGRSANEIAATDILKYQLEFLQNQFYQYGYETLFPVLKDIIQYHFAINQSLMAGPSMDSTLDTDIELKERAFQLAPAVRIIYLEYNPEDLMSVGEYTFEEFIDMYEPKKTSVLIYNFEGEVIGENLEPAWAFFLEQFKQTNSITNVIKDKQFDELAIEEVDEFVEFCLQQTILV